LNIGIGAGVFVGFWVVGFSFERVAIGETGEGSSGLIGAAE